MAMEGQIVNLRQKRKAAAREKEAQKAAENRALYGRPLHQRKLDAAQDALERRTLDGHKRTSDTQEPEDKP